jgi:hypothetical protein
MATIKKAKIGTVENLAPGSTKNFQWNNPPQATVLGYFAYADPPPSGEGPHGSSQGDVEIVRVAHTMIEDNYSGPTERVNIYVKNVGTVPTGFHLYQSWIT